MLVGDNCRSTGTLANIVKSKSYKRMVSSTYFDFRNPFGIKSNFATLPSLTRLLLRCIVGFDKRFLVVYKEKENY